MRLMIAAALASGFAGPAAAQLAPKLTDAPIDITGDRLEVEGDVATWSGSVRAIQGDAILAADQLIADMTGEGDVSRIRAAMKATQFESCAAAPPAISPALTVKRLSPPAAGQRAEILQGSESEIAARIAGLLAEKGLVK